MPTHGSSLALISPSAPPESMLAQLAFSQHLHSPTAIHGNCLALMRLCVPPILDMVQLCCSYQTCMCTAAALTPPRSSCCQMLQGQNVARAGDCLRR